MREVRDADEGMSKLIWRKCTTIDSASQSPFLLARECEHVFVFRTSTTPYLGNIQLVNFVEGLSSRTLAVQDEYVH